MAQKTKSILNVNIFLICIIERMFMLLILYLSKCAEISLMG